MLFLAKSTNYVYVQFDFNGFSLVKKIQNLSQEIEIDFSISKSDRSDQCTLIIIFSRVVNQYLRVLK